MTQPPRPNRHSPDRRDQRSNIRQDEQDDIAQKMVKTLQALKQDGLKAYPIRDLVQNAEDFGHDLVQRGLKTNQIRKFLDAINQLKAKLVDTSFSAIKDETVLLKPKLAYAAARQDAVKPLNEVISEAIDAVDDEKDFYRLVQLVESIIAYHKAFGGKNQ
jgi:CRISPR-associated protein Csm2